MCLLYECITDMNVPLYIMYIRAIYLLYILYVYVRMYCISVCMVFIYMYMCDNAITFVVAVLMRPRRPKH